MKRLFALARKPIPWRTRHLRVLLPIVATWLTASCGHFGEANEASQVTAAFTAWKTAVLNRQTAQAMNYIPRHVDDYLDALNSAPPAPTPVVSSTVSPNVPAPVSQSPGVDLLLRTALDEKVPTDLRSHLTFATLWQRITDRHLFNPRDLRQIEVGAVLVNGTHASAEIFYGGSLTALRLPFVKEDNTWKIDVMAILPYAELLMRVDRAVKGETEAQQVNQLVSKLPAL